MSLSGYMTGVEVVDCKCKGCAKRTLGCHSTCSDYKEYCIKQKEYREWVALQMIGYSDEIARSQYLSKDKGARRFKKNGE